MTIKLIIAPGVEPVTVADVHSQSRIDAAAEDSLLAMYIKATREHFETTYERPLITQTQELTIDAFPDAGIRIRRAPVQSIVSVIYTDANGADQTLSPTLYTLDAQPDATYLLPAYGTTWPATQDSINAVRIRFVAGYGTADDVPATIKVWMLATVATLYANRESIDMTGRTKDLPSRFIDAPLDGYVVYG